MKKIILILLWIIPMTGHASETQKNLCEFIHVKIGERVFELKPSPLLSLNRDEKPFPTPSCYGENVVEVEADNVLFSLDSIPKKKISGQLYFAPIPKGGPFPSVRIGITHWKGVDVLPEEQTAFARTLKYLKRVGLDNYKEWPTENGFYHYKNQHYISSDSKFVTPEGTPVVFSEGGTGYRYQPDITVGGRVSPQNYFPPSKLKEFYHNLTQTITNLDITNQLKEE